MEAAAPPPPPAPHPHSDAATDPHSATATPTHTDSQQGADSSSSSPTPAAAPPFSLSSSLATAVELKAAAAGFVAAGEWSRAVAKYSRIFAYVQGLRLSPQLSAQAQLALLGSGASTPSLDASQRALIDELLLSTNANLALCYHKLGQPQQVIKFASKALEASPLHVKALYRRGAARREVGDLDGSREDLTKAQSLAPADAAIKAELAKLRADDEKDQERTRKRFARMFAA